LILIGPFGIGTFLVYFRPDTRAIPSGELKMGIIEIGNYLNQFKLIFTPETKVTNPLVEFYLAIWEIFFPLLEWGLGW